MQMFGDWVGLTRGQMQQCSTWGQGPFYGVNKTCQARESVSGWPRGGCEVSHVWRCWLALGTTFSLASACRQASQNESPEAGQTLVLSMSDAAIFRRCNFCVSSFFVSERDPCIPGLLKRPLPPHCCRHRLPPHRIKRTRAPKTCIPAEAPTAMSIQFRPVTNSGLGTVSCMRPPCQCTKHGISCTAVDKC